MAEGTYGRGSSYAGCGRDMGREYSPCRDKIGRYSREDGRSEMMEYIKKAVRFAGGEDKEALTRFMRQRLFTFKNAADKAVNAVSAAFFNFLYRLVRNGKPGKPCK